MFSNKRLKSDYVSMFNNKNNPQLPNGYPCTFDNDCQSPAVCQFNVCTVNIGGNDTNDLSNICRGMSIKDCAKEMQKERERTEVPIFVPNIPIVSPTGTTGNNGSIQNIPSVNLCKLDRDCSKTQVCISGVCLDKSNFPLIARQKRLQQSNQQSFGANVPQSFGTFVPQQNIKNNEQTLQQFFQHKKTPLDGTLKPFEYMFMLEPSLENKEETNKNVKLFDDYFYF
jgi:hypothetical protein